MTHYMTLVDSAFQSIKNKTKTIEMRLNDEKRKIIEQFHQIEFTNLKDNEKMYVFVKKLHYYPSFEELYKHFDKISLGYEEDEIANPKDMEQFYSIEKISKYGVVGIEIEVIEKDKSEVERINNTAKLFDNILNTNLSDPLYKIEEMGAFKLIGYKKSFNIKTSKIEIPKFFDHIYSNHPEEVKKYNLGKYALCIDGKTDEFDYIIAGLYENHDNIEQLEIVEIPASKWIKFSCVGALPESIQRLSDEVFNNFFKKHKEYQIVKNYNIEYYGVGDSSSCSYVSQIWVPIK